MSAQFLPALIPSPYSTLDLEHLDHLILYCQWLQDEKRFSEEIDSLDKQLVKIQKEKLWLLQQREGAKEREQVLRLRRTQIQKELEEQKLSVKIEKQKQNPNSPTQKSQTLSTSPKFLAILNQIADPQIRQKLLETVRRQHSNSN